MAGQGEAINVLMLGWELPPYNSGGLGTACLGLTEGLAPLGVDIRFVVPKLFGRLPYDHMKVISAAEQSTQQELEQLFNLSREEIDQLASGLAYGGRLSLDEKRRLWFEQLGSSTPLSPTLQSNWYAHQAAAIAGKGAFDLIHCHDWMTYRGGIAARTVARRMGSTAPLITHVHATEIDRCGENGDQEILRIEQEGLRAADRVVTVSHYTKELVHKHYQIPRQKISVVHNGIPANRQPEQFGLQELKKHHKIVLFMGRITMQKGPDYFVKLAKAVTDRDPSVRFVMVGSGDMEKRCIEEAARLGLTRKMLFSSFLRGTDVDRAYQLADLFVMPSVSEPFGIVALEAIQNGTPALVSKQSGVAEVSQHLIKVDFWDIDTMTEAVLHTLNNPEHQDHLKAGASNDLAGLSWDHSAAAMRSVYQQLLHPAAAARLIHA